MTRRRFQKMTRRRFQIVPDTISLLSTLPIAVIRSPKTLSWPIANRPSAKLPLARVSLGSIAAAQLPRIFRAAAIAPELPTTDQEMLP
jgi:hypothetical protein